MDLIRELHLKVEEVNADTRMNIRLARICETVSHSLRQLLILAKFLSLTVCPSDHCSAETMKPFLVGLSPQGGATPTPKLAHRPDHTDVGDVEIALGDLQLGMAE
jgi:hypothetical protein